MADLSRLSRQQLDALIEAGGDPAKVAPDIASSINHTLYGYTPPPPPMQNALGSGVDSMQASVQTTLADLAGKAGLGSLSGSLQSAAKANAEAANFVSSVPTYKDIGGIGDALTYAKDLALGQAGYYGGLVGAAGAGALAAPFVGVGAGAGALGATLPFMFSTLVGENLNAQMTEKGVPLEETNSLAAYGTGVLQTALEATIGKFLPKGLAVDGIKAFRRAGGIKAVPRLAENAVRGGVVEGLTEGAQQALTIAQANPDKLMSMSPEVIDEIVNAAVAGAVIGGGLNMLSGEFDVARDKRIAREDEADRNKLIAENNAKAKALQDAHKLTVEEQISLDEEQDRQRAEEVKGGPETRNERLLPPPVDTVRRRDDSSFEPGPILPDELIISKDGKEPPKPGLEIVQTEDGFAVRGAVSGTFYKGRLRTREEAQTYKANVEDEIASRWLTKKVKDAELEGDFATARKVIEDAADSTEGYQYSPALIAELSGRVSRNEGAASQVVGHVNNQISAIKEAMAEFKGKKSAPEYASWKTRLAGLEAQRRATMAGLARKNDSFDPDVFPTREPMEQERPNTKAAPPYPEKQASTNSTYEIREVPVKGREELHQVYRVNKKGKKQKLQKPMSAEQAARYRDRLAKKYEGKAEYVTEKVSDASPSFVVFEQQRDPSGNLLGERAANSFDNMSDAQKFKSDTDGSYFQNNDMPPVPTDAQRRGELVNKFFRKLLGDRAPKDVGFNLEYSNVLVNDGTPYEGSEDLTSTGILIKIAARLNPLFDEKQAVEAMLGVGRHEFIHALRDLGAIDPVEWKILTDAAKTIKRPGGYKRLTLRDSVAWLYRNEYKTDRAGNPIPEARRQELLDEEAVAEMFRMWAKDPSILKSKPKVKSIFRRILDMFIGAKDSPDTITMANAILEDIESGEIGGRIKTRPAPSTDVSVAAPGTYTDESGATRAMEGYAPDGTRSFSKPSIVMMEALQDANIKESPVFYSKLLAFVRSSKQPKAPAQQWIGMLKNDVQVKNEEMDWLGVEGWLREQKGPVTREELAEYINANQAKVEDVGRGAFKSSSQDAKARTVALALAEAKARTEKALNSATDTALVEEYIRLGLNRNRQAETLLEDIDSDFSAREQIIGDIAWTYGTRDGQDGYSDVDRLNRLNNSALVSALLAVRPANLDGTGIGGSGSTSTHQEYITAMNDLENEGTSVEHIRQSMIRSIGKFRQAQGLELDKDAAAPTARWEGQYITPGGENYGELVVTMPGQIEKYAPDTHHFTTEGGGTAIAWSRYDDRVGPSGEKILHLQEVQSKRHQDGDKKGYREKGGLAFKDLPDPSQYDQLLAAADAAMEKYEEVDSGRGFVAGRTGAERRQARIDSENAWNLYEVANSMLEKAITRDIKDGFGVVRLHDGFHLRSMPFEGGGVILTDNGYPSLGGLFNAMRKGEIEFPSWSEQGGVPDAPFKGGAWQELIMKRMLRYAVDNGYDQLAWTSGDTQRDRYNLRKVAEELVYNPGQKTFAAYDKDGGEVIYQRNVEPKDLPEYIGKELADKLLGPEGDLGSNTSLKTLSGTAIETGGKFMNKRYDKEIVRYMNKLTKKWGGKVTVTKIEIDTLDSEPDYEAMESYMSAAPDERAEMEAEWEAAKNKKKEVDVWTLPITDQMREGVSRGLPMFSKVIMEDAFKPVRGKNNSPFLGSLSTIMGKMNVELLYGQHSDDPVAQGITNFGARHILSKHGSEIAETTGEKSLLKNITMFLEDSRKKAGSVREINHGANADSSTFRWFRKGFKHPVIIILAKRGNGKLAVATMYAKSSESVDSRAKKWGGASQEDIAKYRSYQVSREITGPMYSIGGKIYSVAEVDYLKKPKGDGGVSTHFDIYADGEDPVAWMQMLLKPDGVGEIVMFPYEGIDAPKEGEVGPNKMGARAVLGIFKQIRALYPNLREVTGNRITGARSSKEVQDRLLNDLNNKKITSEEYDERMIARVDVSRLSATAPIPEGADALYEGAARMTGIQPQNSLWQGILRRAFGVEYEKGDTLGKAVRRNFAHNSMGMFLADGHLKDMLADEGRTPGKMAASKILEMSTQMAGRSEALIGLGMIKYNKETGDITMDEGSMGLAEIFEPISEEKGQDVNGVFVSEQEAYAAYARAKREEGLRDAGRIGYTDLSDRDIERMTDENVVPEHFITVFKNHAAFNEKLMQFALDTGLIDESQKEQFLSISYIPFYRKIDKDAENPAYHGYAWSSRLSESINNPKALMQELIGGDKPIQEDPIEMFARNAIGIVKSGLANQALQRAAETLDEINEMTTDGAPQWGYKVDKPQDGGMNMVFRKNGKEEVYKIVDPSLWYALVALSPQQVNGIIALMSKATNLIRAGITHFPGYMAANLWRGKFEGFVKAGIPLTSWRGTWEKTKEVLKNEPSSLAVRLKIQTGMGGYSMGHMKYNKKGFPESGMGRALKKAIRNKQREKGAKFDYATQWSDGITNLWDKVTAIGEATELAERLVLAEKLMAEGKSEKEALYQALNLINYGRKGAGGSKDSGWVPMAFMNLIPLVPFLNSRIQGLYRMWENPDGQPSSWKTLGLPADMFMRGLMLTAIEAGLWMMFSGDDRWDEERLDRKVNYNVLYAGDTTIYLPRAFEIGAIFGALPTLFMDGIANQDGKDVAAGTAQILLNTFSFNPMPQAVKPAMEMWMNFDTFTGRPIESTAQQRMLPQDRYNQQTSYVARMLSTGTGGLISPIKYDHLINGYLGSLGGGLLATVDTMATATGGMPSRPDGIFGNAALLDPLLGDVIGLRRFIRADDQRANKFIGDFYDLKKQIGEIHASSQEAMLRGQHEYGKELIAGNRRKLALRVPLDRTARRLGDINRSIRSIMNDPVMESGEKRRRLARLRKQKEDAARKMVELINKAE